MTMDLVDLKLVFKRNFPGMEQTIERVPEGWIIELRKPRKKAKRGRRKSDTKVRQLQTDAPAQE